MTLADMGQLLQIYLDDAYGELYTYPMLAMLLNMAQDNVIQELRWDLTPEVNLLATGKSLESDGSYDYVTGLTANPPMFNDRGIVAVKLTGGMFCRRISFREEMEKINKSRTANSFRPEFWAYGKKIWVEPYESQTIDIYYRRRPVQMAFGVLTVNNYAVTELGTPSASQFYGNDGQSLSANDDEYNGQAIYCANTESFHIVTDYVGATRLFTVTPVLSMGTFATGYTFRFLEANPNTGNTECELDQILHDVIVTWAAGLGYQRPNPNAEPPSDFQRRRVRAQEFMDSAMIEIRRLNERYLATDSVGPNSSDYDENLTDSGFTINLDSSGL